MVNTGRWKPIREYFQLRMQILFPGKAVFSPAEVAAKGLGMLDRVAALHNSVNSSQVRIDRLQSFDLTSSFSADSLICFARPSLSSLQRPPTPSIPVALAFTISLFTCHFTTLLLRSHSTPSRKARRLCPRLNTYRCMLSCFCLTMLGL